MKVNKYEWLVEPTSSDVGVRKLFNSLFILGPKSQDLGLQSKNTYATGRIPKKSDTYSFNILCFNGDSQIGYRH